MVSFHLTDETQVRPTDVFGEMFLFPFSDVKWVGGGKHSIAAEDFDVAASTHGTFRCFVSPLFSTSKLSEIVQFLKAKLRIFWLQAYILK